MNSEQDEVGGTSLYGVHYSFIHFISGRYLVRSRLCYRLRRSVVCRLSVRNVLWQYGVS